MPMAYKSSAVGGRELLSLKLYSRRSKLMGLTLSFATSMSLITRIAFPVDGVSNRDYILLGRRDELVGVQRLLGWVVLVRRRCESVGCLEMYAVECMLSIGYAEPQCLGSMFLLSSDAGGF